MAGCHGETHARARATVRAPRTPHPELSQALYLQESSRESRLFFQDAFTGSRERNFRICVRRRPATRACAGSWALGSILKVSFRGRQAGSSDAARARALLAEAGITSVDEVKNLSFKLFHDTVCRNVTAEETVLTVQDLCMLTRFASSLLKKDTEVMGRGIWALGTGARARLTLPHP